MFAAECKQKGECPNAVASCHILGQYLNERPQRWTVALRTFVSVGLEWKGICFVSFFDNCLNL